MSTSWLFSSLCEASPCTFLWNSGGMSLELRSISKLWSIRPPFIPRCSEGASPWTQTHCYEYLLACLLYAKRALWISNHHLSSRRTFVSLREDVCGFRCSSSALARHKFPFVGTHTSLSMNIFDIHARVARPVFPIRLWSSRLWWALLVPVRMLGSVVCWDLYAFHVDSTFMGLFYLFVVDAALMHRTASVHMMCS